MNPNDEATKALMNMTADSIGRDLLGALVQEIKLLPEPWVKVPKAKQDDVIDRLRKQVEAGVRMAVHLLASENRATITAIVDKVAIKDGITASLTLSKADPRRHDLCDAQGKTVLIVVADAGDHTSGMDEIKGESDQRAMNLGHEYDKKAGDKGIEEAKKQAAETATDAVLKLVGQAVEQKDLDEHYEAGRLARRAGKTKEQAPLVAFELVARWVQGWADEDKDIEDGVVDAEFTPGSNDGDGQAQTDSGKPDEDQPQKTTPATPATTARATSKVPAKFRNPATGETWTGRGLKPRWVSQALAEGMSMDDFLIPAAGDAAGDAPAGDLSAD